MVKSGKLTGARVMKGRCELYDENNTGGVFGTEES
jgi:hypothetical protein